MRLKAVEGIAKNVAVTQRMIFNYLHKSWNVLLFIRNKAMIFISLLSPKSDLITELNRISH